MELNRHAYRGAEIIPSEYSDSARWHVRVYHDTDTVMSEELCQQFHTLEQAREYIRRRGVCQ